MYRKLGGLMLTVGIPEMMTMESTLHTLLQNYSIVYGLQAKIPCSLRWYVPMPSDYLLTSKRLNPRTAR